DDVAALQQRHDAVERSALGDDAESRAVEPSCNERVEPARLDRPADEMEAATHFGVILDPSDRRHLPVAEVPGQDEDPGVAPERVDEDIEVVDAHQRALALGPQEAEAEEL